METGNDIKNSTKTTTQLVRKNQPKEDTPTFGEGYEADPRTRYRYGLRIRPESQ